MKNSLIFTLILVNVNFICFSQCPLGESKVIIQVTPDDYPAEMSWKLFADNFEILLGTSNSDTVCVDTSACIRFEIYDSYGDGICCASGFGNFDIIFQGDTIATGGEFTTSSIHEFNCIADTAEIQTALQAMIAHVNNSIPSSLDQREAYYHDIVFDYKEVFSDIESDFYTYINQYEENYPVIYQNRNQVELSSLNPETRLLIDFEQFLIDSLVSSNSVDVLDGILFEFSNIYPGTVSANAPRISNASVPINGTHVHIPSAITAFDQDPAKRPTGYYAAPGEIVTISIPASLINSGIVVQIGTHDDDLSNLSQVNRLYRITNDFQLNQVNTQIISPIGGAIYVKVPEPSNLGWFDITIDQAVKSPYFSLITGHESVLVDWQTQLASHATEWVDIEGDKFMMTLPWAHVENLSDPTSMINQWDAIMDGYNFLGGRPASQRSKAEYFTVDCMLPNAGAFGIGYPQVIGESSAPFGPFGSSGYYPTRVLSPNVENSDLYITFHEMGHAAAHPKLVPERETLVNLYAAFIFDSLYNVPLDMAFKKSEFQLMTLDDASIDWMVTHNFRDNINMSCDPILTEDICDELQYQHRGHAKYVEMAKHFGWVSIHEMNKIFYEQDVINPGTWDDIFKTSDEMIAAASDGNDINMSPLFHFWGLAPSDTLAQRLANDYGYNEVLCQMLHYYKTVVPTTGADLNNWYLNLDHNNFIMDQRYEIYENEFDDLNYYESIHAQIDFLIATYGACTEVGLNGNTFESEIEIGPNPTTGLINIQLPKNQTYNLIVTDALGRLVFSEENINTTNYDFELNQSLGIYLVVITGINGVFVEKILLTD